MAFGRLSGTGRTQVTAEINMIPMIDVMLVLLIIFILTTPLLVHAVKVDLPRVASEADPPLATDITLSLDKDGQVWWGDAMVTTADLEHRLAAEGLKAEAPEVQIRADRAVPYGQVADLMARASRSGLHKLAFVSSPTPPQ
jgi:biopolymer transport protein ExbD